VPDNIVTIDFHRHFRLEAGDWLLDLGSGNGRHTIEACAWPVRVISVDFDREELQKARYHLETPPGISPWDLEARRLNKRQLPGKADFIVADAQHLPFKDAAFDKVLCTEVLEHIPDDKLGIRELYRVTKPGAPVAISVPRFWPEKVFWTLSWEYWHTPGGHVRQYRPGEMQRYLANQGFEIKTVRYRHAFQSIYWFLRCTFGKNNENKLLPRSWFRFINWYHRSRPKAIERVEATLNLIVGKDMIHYGRKPPGPSSNGARAHEEAAQGTRALH
jgi:ubiquinone/menaquinone biosynthesis C-methylase UbiE